MPSAPAREPLLGHEVALYVAVSDAVAKSDTGNVAAMVEAIEAELHEAGHVVTTIAARSDEAPPERRLEVQVLESSSGDATVRGAGRMTEHVAGVVGTAIVAVSGGNIVVDAYVVRGRDLPVVYLGRMEVGSFGSPSDDAIAAGSRSGHWIAWRALHGPKNDSEPPELRRPK